MKEINNWKIYNGKDTEPNAIERLPDPPPWRNFNSGRKTRGETFQADKREIEMVNVALYLRRPLLVTGKPGSGKSSLAYAVAKALDLGDVLKWPINSRSTLSEGLYSYDAIARLRDANLGELKRNKTNITNKSNNQNEKADNPITQGNNTNKPANQNTEINNNTNEPTNQNIDTYGTTLIEQDIGRYIKLGPLGTALLPNATGKPRVLLIDEIDKSDVDLPNDLLHVFEDGEYEIPELVRISDTQEKVLVRPSNSKDKEDRVEIIGGKVKCTVFPFVILTSNGERELPPAFFRRCLRLEMEQPEDQRLRDIVLAHLEKVDPNLMNELIGIFDTKRNEENKTVAVDQLLNAIFLVIKGNLIDEVERKRVIETIMKELSGR